MDKKGYLAQLSSHLKDLNREEFGDAMHYVEEYFDEAGVENEQDVIKELGSPQKYAAQIKATATIKENRQRSYGSTSTSGIKTIWYIIAGICALPVALPLLLVAFALLLTFICLIVAFAIAGFGIVLAGYVVSIPLLISSFPIFATSIPDGLMAFGIPLLILGGSIFATSALILVTSRFIPWIIHLLSDLFYKLKGGSKNEKQ